MPTRCCGRGEACGPIAFVTQKGGAARARLCISLAVAAQEAGQSVCILEMDRQATISDWAEHRTRRGPEVAQIEATQIDGVMTQLRDGLRLRLHRHAGRRQPGTLSAIRAADLCIIPCRPTPADLRAFKPTLAAVYRLEKRFAFVLNQTPPRSYRVRDAADGLAVARHAARREHRHAQRPPGRARDGAGRHRVQPDGARPPRRSAGCGPGSSSAGRRVPDRRCSARRHAGVRNMSKPLKTEPEVRSSPPRAVAAAATVGPIGAPAREPRVQRRRAR